MKVSVGSVLLGAALVTLGLTCASAQTWKKYTSTADGFEVDFSGDVAVAPTQADAATAQNMVRSTNYLQDGGSFAYIVGASLLKVDVNFDKGVHDSFGAVKCQTTSADLTLQFPQGRGRELDGTACLDGSVTVDARYFTVGKWFYQVAALFQTQGGDAAAARHFIESFKVTGAQ
jgi:hypothetical protein